jgi:predicted dehydrogenase
MEATIMGTDGWIHLPSPWWVGHTLVLRRPGKEGETIECPYIANGYSHEAMEVAECVAAGKLESEVMSLDESLALMATMDEIRRQIGLKYPADNA